MIQCNHFHKQYIGETKRRLKDRFNAHRRPVDKQTAPNSPQHPNKFLYVYQSGSPRGGPWSPWALKFLLWSLEPDHFTDWNPDPFLAVVSGAQRNFGRSPEPSIQVCSFEFPDCIDSWLLPFCICLCVLTGIKKRNLKRGQYIIQVYAVIVVHDDMQQLI